MVLFLLTVCVFSPVLFNGYIWDDAPHIQENVNLRSVGGLVEIWTRPSSMPQYYPVFHTMLWVGYRLFGAAPWGFHALSVVVHAGSAVLLWRLLVRLQVRWAWLAAALFAVHPVQVETVGWAMELKTVLSGFFYFLALGVLLPCWGIGGEVAEGAVLRRRYLVGALLFLFSLLSKSVTASLPAVILLLVGGQRGRISKREVWRAVPLFVIGICSGLLTAMLERTRVGADGPEWDIPLVERVLIAGRAIFFYVGKIVWPEHLAFFYRRWVIDSSAWWQYLFPAAVVVLVVVLGGWRKRIGRGWLAGWLFFVGTLFPALGFFNVYPMRFSFVADHFQYLAMIGVCVMIAAGLSAIGRRGVAVGVVALGVLGTLTVLRGRVFADDFTLMKQNVRAEPESWMARTVLCHEYLARGDVGAAMENATWAMALRPNDVDVRENFLYALAKVGDGESARLAMALPRGISADDPRLKVLVAAGLADARSVATRP